MRQYPNLNNDLNALNNRMSLLCLEPFQRVSMFTPSHKNPPTITPYPPSPPTFTLYPPPLSPTLPPLSPTLPPLSSLPPLSPTLPPLSYPPPSILPSPFYPTLPPSLSPSASTLPYVGLCPSAGWCCGQRWSSVHSPGLY